MRVTRKMMNNNSVYNINVNKSNLDALNTQMATQKKYTDPSDDPITAVRSLRFRSNLSEVSQYLDRNASDAESWIESTASAIDTAKELMRSLKAEYTSAANGTNETNDQWIYYENMKHIVDEYFDVGNTASEDRYIFTGYRTDRTLTFTAKDFEERENAVSNGKFEYKGIDEHFESSDIEKYTFTARSDKAWDAGEKGVTDSEIFNLDPNVNETKVENVNAYRMRLSYEEIDKMQKGLIKVTNPDVRKYYSTSQTLHIVDTRNTALFPESGSGLLNPEFRDGDMFLLAGESTDKIKTIYVNPTKTDKYDAMIADAEKAVSLGKNQMFFGIYGSVEFEVVDTVSQATDPNKLYIAKNDYAMAIPDSFLSSINNLNQIDFSLQFESDPISGTQQDQPVSEMGYICIEKDEEINQEILDQGGIYLNVVTGNLIFGEDVQKKLSKYFSEGYDISYAYDKSTWYEGDVKPEYYFDCKEVGLGTEEGKAFVYNDHLQSMNYHVGDSQSIKVNTNASEVFVIDARRDLDEIYDFLTALDNANSKLNRIKDMMEDTERYGTESQQHTLSYLYEAAKKEVEYTTERVNGLMSRGMTKASEYFDYVNLAATNSGTTSKRLELIKNRLTEDKTTVRTQTSNNENVDLSTLSVDVSEASLLYSAALQVTGKISQQTLVNYI